MRRFRQPRALILSRPAVIVTLAIAFALVLATGLLTTLSTRGLAVAEQRAVQAQRTLGLALQLLATQADAAISVRRAIISEQPAPLANYEAARARHAADLAALQREFGREGTPEFIGLQQLSAKRFAAFDHALDALRTRGPLPALALVDSAKTAHTADEIRRLVASLQRSQFDELAVQSADAARRAAKIRALNVGLLLGAGIAALGLARWLTHRVRDLDTMVTVCAWTRRVLWQGKWITFEEYLIERFDVRCTHGICEEAAGKMKAEASKLQVPAELRRRKSTADVDLASGRPAPFA
jgi:CHASE3 domain sensor protein